MQTLLNIVNLSKTYIRNGSLFHAVKNISLNIQKNEIMGLVGESGSGKSTLAKMILMLEKPEAGEIFYQQQHLLQLRKKEKLMLRREIQIVFQNPYSALNPRMTLLQILQEPLDIHQLFTGASRFRRIRELIAMIGLEKDHLSRYPHQFSGGQRQRICIARALAIEPKLLVCDEPLSALDLSVQSQMIELLQKCHRELGLTMLFISHDLAVVSQLAHRVAVMYRGEIVEQGLCKEVFNHPQHFYTQQLLEAYET